MKIISKLKSLVKGKQEQQPKTNTKEEIENYIETEKFKQNLDNVKKYERDSFLYGSDSNG